MVAPGSALTARITTPVRGNAVPQTTVRFQRFSKKFSCPSSRKKQECDLRSSGIANPGSGLMRVNVLVANPGGVALKRKGGVFTEYRDDVTTVMRGVVLIR